MAISDRTRKLLWGHSGNRCAICRCLLTADPTNLDPVAVVGDECHIVARQVGGPRGDQPPEDSVDGESNLLLLCRTDHKRVDDQPAHFSPDRLRSIKTAHESWVRSMLDTPKPPSFQATLRPSDRSKSRLTWVATGAGLFDIISGAMAYDFSHDELTDANEVELVADFLQSLHELGEVEDDMESGDRVRERFRLSNDIKTLGEAGFWIYGAQVPRVLDANKQQIRWPVATVRIKRLSDLLLHFAREAEAEAQADGKTPSPQAAV